MESAKQVAKGLSEELNRSRESTTTSQSVEYCPTCQYPLWQKPCQNCVTVEKYKKWTEEVKSNSEKQAASDMMARIGGKRFYDDFTLEKFVKTKTNSPAVNAVANFSPEKENLYIHGPTGTGKTHLAVIAGRRFRSVRFLRTSELSRSIRFSDESWTESDIIDFWTKNPVVILDDLGTSKDTAFTLDLLYELVDQRYRDGRNGLIVTSNLSLSELAAKLNDDRVPSRLAQMCKIFPLTGEKDWRLKR